MRRLIPMVLTAALTAAESKLPPVAVPAQFAGQSAAGGTTSDTASLPRWWTVFQDPQLNALLERVARANLDVRLAASRIAESRAVLRTSRADLLPTLDQSNSFNRLRGGFNQGIVRIPGSGQQRGGNVVSPFETNSFSLGLNASWELDVFSRVRQGVSAAAAAVQASEESRRDVLVLALSEAGRNYLELRGTQSQLAIARRNVALQQETLELTRVRAAAGLAAELDVERQTAQLATTSAAVPPLQASEARLMHALAVLAGEPPEALTAQLIPAAPLPALPPAVPVGLPSDLLKRRPDVRQAEAEATAALARVGVAKAELLPRFLLTGSSGRLATSLAGFALGAGNFFALGPAISLPLFQGGRLKANVAAAEARWQQSLTRFEQVTLTALQETEDALSAYGRQRERQRSLRAAVDASQRAVELAQELYRSGLGDFLAVLDAQRSQLAAETALAESETAAATSLVAVYQALGGGWEVAP